MIDHPGFDLHLDVESLTVSEIHDAAPNRASLVELYRDLPRGTCATCGATSVPIGSTCPKSITCPDCKARPNARCKRPSGHEAQETHRARWEKAEIMDVELLA